MKLDSRYTNISNETSFTGDIQALSYMPASLKEAARTAFASGVTNAKMTTIAPDKDTTWQEGVRLSSKVERGGQLDQDALIARLQQSYTGKLEKMTERGGAQEQKALSGFGASLTELTSSGAQLATAAATGLTAVNTALNQQQQGAAQPVVVQEEPTILGIPVKWAILGAGLAVVAVVVLKGKKQAPGVLPVVSAKRKRRKK